jgi:hypothetical protein
VYSRAGGVRFRALEDQDVALAEPLGRYVYVTIGRGDRFSVDLTTGRVRGPLRSAAQLVFPDLVAIP